MPIIFITLPAESMTNGGWVTLIVLKRKRFIFARRFYYGNKVRIFILTKIKTDGPTGYNGHVTL